MQLRESSAFPQQDAQKTKKAENKFWYWIGGNSNYKKKWGMIQGSTKRTNAIRWYSFNFNYSSVDVHEQSEDVQVHESAPSSKMIRSDVWTLDTGEKNSELKLARTYPQRR